VIGQSIWEVMDPVGFAARVVGSGDHQGRPQPLPLKAYRMAIASATGDHRDAKKIVARWCPVR